MKLLLSFSLLVLCLLLGNLLAQIIPLPASILGMLILYLILLSKKIPERYTAPACVLFMKYMVVLFIPVSVGIISCWQEIKDFLLAIILACLGGSIILLISVAAMVEIYERRNAKNGAST